MSNQDLIQPLYESGHRLGPFEIQRLLGSGAFADVYLANNVHLDQRVALKVIRRAEAEPLEQQGAQMMCRLQHPNIVTVRFADRTEGRLVIAMDYVDGETLAQKLRPGEALDLATALNIATAVCAALDYVHTLEIDGCHGLAHLDLKPSNVLIDKNGAVKIADFGIAQWLRQGEGVTGVPTGGSPAYMAPEQFEGKSAAQSDLWAVGILLCQMLTGETPFHGKTVEEYREAVCTEAPEFGPRFSELPAGVRDVIRRCLERDLDRRFRSAKELVSALAESSARQCPRCGASLPADSDLCAECTLAQPTLERAPHKWTPARKRRRLYWIALLVAAALAASAYGGYWAWRNLRPEWIARRTGDSSAAKKLKLGEEDQRQFSAAEQLDKQPGTKICAALAAWNDYLAHQETDFQRAYAQSRIQFWTNALNNYTGYAELSVISAAGLPPSDHGIFGHSRPDPYFVLQQSGRELYRSRLLNANPAPSWNEKTRVFLRPDLDLTLEIHDKKLVGSRLLLRRNLIPLPPDGRFRVVEGSIEVDLEIARER